MPALLEQVSNMNALVANSAVEIEEALHGECPTPIVKVALDGQTVSDLSAGAACFLGSAHLVTFTDCDFRGADLSRVTGDCKFVRCLTHGADLPKGSVTVECYSESLFCK